MIRAGKAMAKAALAWISVGCETGILTRASRANPASCTTDVVSEAVGASINTR